jgi:hypothetical protein
MKARELQNQHILDLRPRYRTRRLVQGAGTDMLHLARRWRNYGVSGGTNAVSCAVRRGSSTVTICQTRGRFTRSY